MVPRTNRLAVSPSPRSSWEQADTLGEVRSQGRRSPAAWTFPLCGRRRHIRGNPLCPCPRSLSLSQHAVMVGSLCHYPATDALLHPGLLVSTGPKWRRGLGRITDECRGTDLGHQNTFDLAKNWLSVFVSLWTWVGEDIESTRLALPWQWLWSPPGRQTASAIGPGEGCEGHKLLAFHFHFLPAHLIASAGLAGSMDNLTSLFCTR